MFFLSVIGGNNRLKWAIIPPYNSQIHKQTLGGARQGASVVLGETMQKFLLGDKNRVYQMLGIPYGFFFFEDDDDDTKCVSILARGRQLLAEKVRDEIINGKNAVSLEQEMYDAGLLEDMEAVRAKAAAYISPSRFKPSFRFEMCKNKDCKIPVPHGSVMKIGYKNAMDKNIAAAGFTNFVDGLDVVTNLANDLLTVDAAVLISQIAKSATLPVDKAASQALFDAMSRKTRQKIAKRLFEGSEYNLSIDVVGTASLFSRMASQHR